MSEYKSLVNKMVQVAVEPCDDMFMLIPILWDYSKEISKNWYKYFEKGC